ncbi:hypothetical protein A2U01_0061542 [Trifolium medium]|uniref:Uncharacterized protein n=1 Tax=Trifolium medium TaxID=97028 RepID=A0A392RVB0_9FABA|nr:hypothetical protein [Trifolium medium]
MWACPWQEPSSTSGFQVPPPSSSSPRQSWSSTPPIPSLPSQALPWSLEVQLSDRRKPWTFPCGQSPRSPASALYLRASHS